MFPHIDFVLSNPKSHTSRRISSLAGHFIIAPTDNFSSKYELESMIKLYGRVFPMWFWKMDFQGFRLLCARRVVRFSCFCFTKNCSFLVFFFLGWSFGLKCAQAALLNYRFSGRFCWRLGGSICGVIVTLNGCVLMLMKINFDRF